MVVSFTDEMCPVAAFLKKIHLFIDVWLRGQHRHKVVVYDICVKGVFPFHVIHTFREGFFCKGRILHLCHWDHNENRNHNYIHLYGDSNRIHDKYSWSSRHQFLYYLIFWTPCHNFNHDINAKFRYIYTSVYGENIFRRLLLTIYFITYPYLFSIKEMFWY